MEKLPPLPTRIDLVLKTAAGEVRAAAPAKANSPDPRPTASVGAGTRPQIRWSVVNTDPKEAVRSIVVHFFVTKTEKLGIPLVTGPQKGSAIDSVLGTDLSAKLGTTGNYNTPLSEPGLYLVGIEILDQDGNRRQLCTLEVKVEAP